MSIPITSKSVAICDTEPIAIEGVRALLSQCDDLHLAAADSSLLGGLEIARQHLPAIMILDKSFGTHAIMDCLKRLHVAGIPTAAVVWGTNVAESEALHMLQAGALGVVRKTAPIETLLECLRTVATGNTWMEESVLQEPEHMARGNRANLTSRELQVVELVEQGLKNRDIATQLGIRPGTVKIHLKHIFEKTGIRGRYGLALSGLREKGVLSLPAA
ncbi:MAG TPA: response regulator transcription factor [Bryobacteraceae bacterium]|nr:response regulator transcription factor [Bryobacteraceae bacterium]